MAPYVPLIIFGAAAAFVVLIVVLSVRAERKRRDALRGAAQEMGLSFDEKGDDTLLDALGSFHLFSQGHSRRIRNVVHGVANEIDLKLFDYRYTTGGGRHAHTHTQTVLLFRCPELNLPAFALRPEHLFHKIGAVFGGQDIDFDEHPDFSASYLLRGEDEEAIRRIFDEEVLSFYGQSRGLSTEGAGQELVFYRASKRVKPAELSALMEEGFVVLSLFRRDREGTADTSGSAPQP